MLRGFGAGVPLLRPPGFIPQGMPLGLDPNDPINVGKVSDWIPGLSTSDFSPNNNSLVKNGTPGIVPTINGLAATFNSSPYFGSTKNVAALGITNKISAVVWAVSTSASQVKSPFGNDSGSPDADSLTIFDNSGVFWARVSNTTQTSGNGVTVSGGTWTPNRLFAIFVEYDSATVSLYVNNLFIASAAQTGNVYSGPAWNIGSRGGYGFPFSGYIFRVTLWARALLPSERAKVSLDGFAGLIFPSDYLPLVGTAGGGPVTVGLSGRMGSSSSGRSAPLVASTIRADIGISGTARTALLADLSLSVRASAVQRGIAASTTGAVLTGRSAAATSNRPTPAIGAELASRAATATTTRVQPTAGAGLTARAQSASTVRPILQSGSGLIALVARAGSAVSGRFAALTRSSVTARVDAAASARSVPTAAAKLSARAAASSTDRAVPSAGSALRGRSSIAAATRSATAANVTIAGRVSAAAAARPNLTGAARLVALAGRIGALTFGRWVVGLLGPRVVLNITGATLKTSSLTPGEIKTSTLTQGRLE